VKTISVLDSEPQCSQIIDQVNRDQELVTTTNDGEPVTIWQPIPQAEPSTILGAHRGTVLRYEEPCSAALDPADWKAACRRVLESPWSVRTQEG